MNSKLNESWIPSYHQVKPSPEWGSAYPSEARQNLLYVCGFYGPCTSMGPFASVWRYTYTGPVPIIQGPFTSVGPGSGCSNTYLTLWQMTQDFLKRPWFQFLDNRHSSRTGSCRQQLNTPQQVTRILMTETKYYRQHTVFKKHRAPDYYNFAKITLISIKMVHTTCIRRNLITTL